MGCSLGRETSTEETPSLPLILLPFVYWPGVWFAFSCSISMVPNASLWKGVRNCSLCVQIKDQAIEHYLFNRISPPLSLSLLENLRLKVAQSSLSNWTFSSHQLFLWWPYSVKQLDSNQDTGEKPHWALVVSQGTAVSLRLMERGSPLSNKDTISLRETCSPWMCLFTGKI